MRRVKSTDLVRSRRCAAGALFLAAAAVHAQITVEGIVDKTVYTDRAVFTIAVEEGYDYTAALNGRPVPAGVEVAVADADFYELAVSRTPQAGGAPETGSVLFIVRASARADTEWGLPPWTPFPGIPSAADEFAGAQLRITAPERFPLGLEIPIVARVENAAGGRAGVNGTVTAAGVPDLAVRLFRGWGSGFLPAAAVSGERAFTARVGPIGAQVAMTIEPQTTWTAVGSTISASADWGDDARVHITASISVAAGATLTVGAGSVVKLAPGVAVTVDGTLRVNGTRARPVVFLPESRSTPWGGLRFRTSASVAELQGAILTGSGANPTWFDDNSGVGSSHRKEEPCIYLQNGARATLADCAVIDSPGQFGHSEGSYLSMTRCLVQKHTTGGQYNGAAVTLTDCALIEFPYEGAPFADADNDGMYLSSGTHSLTACLVGWAGDDGIDGGGSGPELITFQSCWFESCVHEALAMSTAGRRVVRDLVLTNCGQGIECGYGSESIDAARCLSTANLVGARFGDCYDWDYDGFLTVADSLLLHNRRDVWGRAWDTWEEHLSQMDIHDNYLTAADPLHPDNAVWQPPADAALLVPFMPAPEGAVGIGLAAGADSVEASAAAAGVPVRLSTFTTHAVAVDYTLSAAGEPLAAGTLEFLPGETLKRIPFDAAALPVRPSYEIVLANPEGAELTGATLVAIVQDIVLIPAGSVWKYLDNGVDQGVAWRDQAFDDAAWESGPAELGYGDDDEATVVAGGPSTARFPTTYFRRSFDVPDPTLLDALSLKLKRDDGAVVYLNGAEVLRDGMPEGAIAYETLASITVSGDDEDAFYEAELAPDGLVAGANIIAVEVHQVAVDSSDVSFDLELAARYLAPPPPGFVRGDANGDGVVDLSDPVMILLCLFAGRATDCEDALDANDGGRVDIADAVYVLSYLFAHGAAMPAPFPAGGEDTTPDALGCSR